MSEELHYLIYFCIIIVFFTFWNWLERSVPLTTERQGRGRGRRRRREEALRRNPQRSLPAGYHVINISTIPGGVDGDILKSIPTLAYDAASGGGAKTLECVVCLSTIEDKELCRRLPACNHTFHADCIDMWFYSHNNCPICRAAVEIPLQPTGLLAHPPGSDSGST